MPSVPQHVFAAFFYLCRCFVPLLSMVMVVSQHNMYPPLSVALRHTFNGCHCAMPCHTCVQFPAHPIHVVAFHQVSQWS